MLEQQDTASVERPREPARDDDHEADHARVREELEQVARLAVVAARHHDVSAVCGRRRLFMGERAVLLQEDPASSGTMGVVPREKRKKGAGTPVSAMERGNADLCWRHDGKFVVSDLMTRTSNRVAAPRPCRNARSTIRTAPRLHDGLPHGLPPRARSR